MIQSMTGYGKATQNINDKKVFVEIKSLNSKHLDLNLRIPSFYKEKELLIRNSLTKTITRGKVDLSLYVELPESSKVQKLNQEIVKTYFNDLKSLAGDLSINMDKELLQLAVKMPDTMSSEKEDLDETEWKLIDAVIKEAVVNFTSFREQEGAVLYTDIKSRIDNIAKLLTEVEPFETKRVNTIKERITKNIDDHFSSVQKDNNRFEQELIYYMEKLDITEEKVRLKGHLDYFMEVMNNESNQGKKLGFIGQEIGREINTLGSKANQQDMQKIVVQMKDELEKLKEQILNTL